MTQMHLVPSSEWIDDWFGKAAHVLSEVWPSDGKLTDREVSVMQEQCQPLIPIIGELLNQDIDSDSDFVKKLIVSEVVFLAEQIRGGVAPVAGQSTIVRLNSRIYSPAKRVAILKHRSKQYEAERNGQDEVALVLSAYFGLEELQRQKQKIWEREQNRRIAEQNRLRDAQENARKLELGELPFSGEYLLLKIVRSDQYFLSTDEVFHVVVAVEEVTAAFWIKYGTRQIPDLILAVVAAVLQKTIDRIDIRSGEWDYYGLDGLPCRPEPELIFDTLFVWCSTNIAERVRGKLRFDDAGWHSVRPQHLLDAIVRRYREISVGQSVDPSANASELDEVYAHPAPQPYGISPAGAERWVRDWMRHKGAHDAETTQLSGDGGVDIISSECLAQVKLYASPVPIAEIREFAGATMMLEQRNKLFFCSGGFSRAAPEYADQASIALFSFNPELGEVLPENQTAEELLVSGLHGSESGVGQVKVLRRTTYSFNSLMQDGLRSRT